jgi:hypothetical protein
MSTDPALFSNVARKDYLDLYDQGEPRYDRIAKFLGFGNREVAQAAGVPVSKVRLDAKLPAEVEQRFREWAVVLNLVAQFFEGDGDKTSLWFSMPNPLLGGVVPRDMLRIGRFRRLYHFVIDALAENLLPDPQP